MSYADIIKRAQKAWKCDKPLVNSVTEVEGEKIPFTSPLLNWVTYGGIPRNRISVLYGDYGSGKTTTVLDICVNAAKKFREEFDAEIADLRQRLSEGDKSVEDRIEELQERGPKKVVYLDIEHAFDTKWAALLGLIFDGSITNIDVIQPPNVVAEDILQFIREIVETGEIGLIAVDSVIALTPKTVLEKTIGERTVAALAGLLAVFHPIIVPMLTRYGCTLVEINQIRDNLANPYDVNIPGGKSIKFYPSFMARFRKGRYVDFLGNELPNNTDNPSGCIIEMQVTKQKTAPNDRRLGTYYLMFNSGIRPDFDFAQLAINSYSLIRKSGGWFSFVSPITGELITAPDGKPVKVHGMDAVYNYLNSDTEYYEALQKYILDDISGKSDSDGEEAD